MVRKGVTPVISLVLLIMIAIVLIGSAYYWMTNIQGGLQESVGSNVESTSQAATEFNIISIMCKESDDSITITAYNTGELTLDASNAIVTVSNIDNSVLGVDIDVTETPSSVTKDATFQIVADGMEWDLEDEKSYSVKVNIGNYVQTTTCMAS